MPARPPALLVLEDGTSFLGRSFGAPGTTFGEAVFSTGMTGYQESLTDPSYHRQVLISTAPHVGNTGWTSADSESERIWAAGFVARDPARVPSSWRSVSSLDDALAAQQIVGICQIDTRALTRHLRERGAMRVGVSTAELDPQRLREQVLATQLMSGANLVDEVTTKRRYTVDPATGTAALTVVAVDLGIKQMTPARLAARGIRVHVVPAGTGFAEIQELAPDGVFFSNGPGDPATADREVSLLREVLRAEIPFFGICFGNQLLGRALGLSTYKLSFGHRGINQPVMDLATRKVEVTAHNHGFAVRAPTSEMTGEFGRVRVSHRCLNDDVVEGLEVIRGGKVVAFSVQYHPEAAAGPHDADYLFDRFVTVMRGTAGAANAAS